MLREVLDAETVIGFWESRWVLREVLDAEIVIGFWENRWVLREVFDTEIVRRWVLGVDGC